MTLEIKCGKIYGNVCYKKDVIYLSVQAIEKIREIEKNTELMEKTAKADAEKMLENAKIEAKVIVERAMAEGKSMVEKAVADATGVARNNSKESQAKSNSEVSMLESITEKKLSQAVDMVKDKLIS